MLSKHLSNQAAEFLVNKLLFYYLFIKEQIDKCYGINSRLKNDSYRNFFLDFILSYLINLEILEN